MFNIPYESVDYFTNRYIFTFYFVGGLGQLMYVYQKSWVLMLRSEFE